MSRDPLDLSGRWDGVFRYPGDRLPATPFVADISEDAGAFDGTTMEPDLYRDGPVGACIAGVRAGRSVDFTKTYVGARHGYVRPVDYVGQLSEDGETITGSWTLQEWDGSFEMTRLSRAQALEEERAAEEVD